MSTVKPKPSPTPEEIAAWKKNDERVRNFGAAQGMFNNIMSNAMGMGSMTFGYKPMQTTMYKPNQFSLPYGK